MRGSNGRSGELFSYVDLETRVRADHPLRAIRSLDDVLNLSHEMGWVVSSWSGYVRVMRVRRQTEGATVSEDTGTKADRNHPTIR